MKKLKDCKDLTYARWREKLPDDLARRAKLVWDAFYPFAGTLAKWLDGFCYDLHPDREIALWEKYASFFKRLTAGKSLRKKAEVWHKLCLCIGETPVVQHSPDSPKYKEYEEDKAAALAALAAPKDNHAAQPSIERVKDTMAGAGNFERAIWAELLKLMTKGYNNEQRTPDGSGNQKPDAAAA